MRNQTVDDFTKGVAICLAQNDGVDLATTIDTMREEYVGYAISLVQAGFDYVALCKRERK